MNIEKIENTLQLPSPIIPFTPDWEGVERVSLSVKRDDLIHPVISGNKWRKLKHTLRQAPSSIQGIVSFGGGYSNHLHALGFVCHSLGIACNAIIRGDYTQHPSPMILDLMRWNVQITYVDRKTYARRHDEDYWNRLQLEHPGYLIIPEGGSQVSALRGVAELVTELNDDVDTIVAPVASGATMAGIIAQLQPSQRALGIGVLKGEGYLESLVSTLLPSPFTNWSINHNYHCGGYAKIPHYLADFCASFNAVMPFSIEGVYSGKVFWALRDMLAQGCFEDGERIVVLHTGGLQGAR